MAETIDMGTLENAVCGKAAAFRAVVKMQPAGGTGDKVFPPTYEGGKYAVEERVTNDGEVIPCVLLDSVQSQANRMEIALLDAVRAGRFELPLLTVTFDHEILKKKVAVTSLEAPHRVADAIFRDSLLDGELFRHSEKGKILDSADIHHATELFGLCPTALLFGMWDSTGPRGGLGAKFQRAIVSEIIGVNAVPGVKTSSRIDPLQITLGAGPLYKRNSPESGRPDWTFDSEEAEKKKNKAVKLGKDGKPSEANHGNVTPTIADGGFTIGWAQQTTTISLAAIRRLRFPGDGGESPEANYEARAVVTALGLTASTLAIEAGLDLRSRCQLFPAEKPVWELLDSPGEEPKRFTLGSDDAVELLKKAVAAARKAGLPWEGEMELEPSDDLLQLLARSQELKAEEGTEGE